MIRVRVKVFIYNPRIFRLFLDCARRYGLEFSVPDTPSCAKEEVLVVDEEAIKLLNIRCGNYVIVNESNIESIIAKLMGIRESPVITVGLDLGSKIAYAILADNKLIDFGYVTTEDLISKLSRLKRVLNPKKIITRIGMPSSDELINKLKEISEKLLEIGAEVYIVNEERSSSPSKLIRSFGDITGNLIKNKDINAALNLALRVS